VHPSHDDLARLWAVDGVGPHMSCSESSGGRVFMYSKRSALAAGPSLIPIKFIWGRGRCFIVE
jgi:hypothetical protein